MGSFHNWESKRSLPLTLLGIERGILFGLTEEDGALEGLLLALPDVGAKGMASRWACMRV